MLALLSAVCLDVSRCSLWQTNNQFLIHISAEMPVLAVDPHLSADRVLGLSSHSYVIDCLSSLWLTFEFIDRIPISIGISDACDSYDAMFAECPSSQLTTHTGMTAMTPMTLLTRLTTHSSLAMSFLTQSSDRHKSHFFKFYCINSINYKSVLIWLY